MNNSVYYSFESFAAYRSASLDELQTMVEIERKAALEGETFLTEGKCYVCNQVVEFHVDYQSSSPRLVEGKRVPNWRERLVCPSCNLNNRMRAVVHLLEAKIGVRSTDKIYITERKTILFRVLKSRFPKIIGSEFLGEDRKGGRTNLRGVRHEDVRHLSFETESLDFILTFDVLEHVPQYARALAEFARCLKPGGQLALTVPFILSSPNTVVRASYDDKGKLVHHLPPEFHGNPIDPDVGILCYYHFGWDLLNKLKQAGFASSSADLYWSAEFGYLGGFQVVIRAIR